LRRLAHLLVIVLALSLFAACQTHSLYRNATSTSKQPPKPTTTSAAQTNNGAIRLHPPDFTLVANEGTQEGVQGAYYWQLKNGLAAGYPAAGFSTVEIKQLDVAQNEQLTINLANGPYPDNLELRIYPQDGNYVDVPVPGGTVKQFQLKTDPLQTHTFTDTPYQWTANVAPGGYFIFLSGTWTNPFTPPSNIATPRPVKPLTSEIAFWINVK
jgi:hypothetical protein